MAGRPTFVNRPAPTATGPQPATSMEVTREALWLLQALCGVERMPAVLVTRPFTDTGDPAERPLGHPGVEVLREKWLVFVDEVLIDGWLTEINVTSPTGIQELERFDGTNAAAMIWEAVERRVETARG